MRFWSIKLALPYVPGGVLGFEIGRVVTLYLGFTGGTLILLALWMTGHQPVLRLVLA